jgi:glycine cleavage system H lipoate-binding protein
MVFLLVFLTVGILLTIDFILRREDRKIKAIGQEKKSPIFLSPEKALLPLANGKKKLYHLSHTWVQPLEGNAVYIGFDNFVSDLFSSEIQIENLPLVGTHVPQGTKIWDVGLSRHKVSQLAPISGEVVDINPACKLNIPLTTGEVEKSWVIKMKSDDLSNELHNLMRPLQASIMNTAMRDELFLSAHKEEHFLNDGGAIDPNYINNMPDDQWEELCDKFFSYGG